MKHSGGQQHDTQYFPKTRVPRTGISHSSKIFKNNLLNSTRFAGSIAGLVHNATDEKMQWKMVKISGDS